MFWDGGAYKVCNDVSWENDGTWPSRELYERSRYANELGRESVLACVSFWLFTALLHQLHSGGSDKAAHRVVSLVLLRLGSVDPS